MKDVILTFFVAQAITFCLLLFIAFLVSYCKRRQRKTPHGLTGMCHQNGGTMCSSCSSKLAPTPGRNT